MQTEPKLTLLYGSEWSESLSALLNSAQSELVIATPFISLEGAAFVKQNTTPAFRRIGKLTIITNLSERNMAFGVTDPHALRALRKHFQTIAIRDLRSLHAKIYIGDSKQAIITSANLTNGGLAKNLECGTVVITEDITQLRSYLLEAATAGNDVTEKLDDLIALAQKLQADVQPLISSALEAGGDKLAVIEGNGESRNALFQQVILATLESEGPLSVRYLYPQIQRRHPNLCDDDERDFRGGKLSEPSWKHRVRAALEGLQRKGRVALLADGRWMLAQGATV